MEIKSEVFGSCVEEIDVLAELMRGGAGKAASSARKDDTFWRRLALLRHWSISSCRSWVTSTMLN
ncbi:MAG: hypothetical protein RLZZ89_1651 [Cyanobacteriota bacterium]|jgi:hypothetical protein